MTSNRDDPPSPGPNDENKARLTTPGAVLDDSFDDDLTTDRIKDDFSGISDVLTTKPQAHQGGIKTSGDSIYDIVLWCDGLDLSYNFGKIFSIFKAYGPIDRIKAKIIDKTCISAFITFVSNLSAKEALNDMVTRLDMSKVSFSIISSRNVAEEESDYIPKLFSEYPVTPTIKREEPIPLWYVVSYREENNNSLKGLIRLESYIGKIPEENFKKYGKGSLIKAKNDLQALMLQHFVPTEEDNISSIKPHNSFNLVRGVIYSEELQAFSVEEILELCPSNIYQVQKLKGPNNAIILHFSSKYCPDYLKIRHLNFRVRKYRPRPKQCFNCFDYGHVAPKCQKGKKCNRCSAEMSDDHNCTAYYCCHCEGEHSPQSRLCPRYRFEQDIVETSHNEYISFGKAKGKLMGANKSPESTYAKVVAKMKINNLRKSPSTPTRRSISDLSQINTVIAHESNPNLSQTDPSAVVTSLSVKPKEKTQEDNSIKSKDIITTKNVTQTSASHLRHHQKNPRKLKGPKPSPSADEEGFWTLERHKRARPVSPKSNTGVPTKNIYDVLEETPPAKKKTSKEPPVTLDKSNRDKSQPPNRHMEIDNPQIPGIQEKTRIPVLDRKLTRDKNFSSASSRSEEKTGNTRFKL